MKLSRSILGYNHPMNTIQQTFLISADIGRWLEKQTVATAKIEQFYVKPDIGTQCYYAKHFPDTYTKVIISKEEGQSVVPVSQEVYLSHGDQRVGIKLVKNVSTVNIEDEVFEFRMYERSLEGLCILVATFVSEKSARESEVLETLQPFILKETSKDGKYTEEALSLYGKPMEYNLDKMYGQIDAFEASNLFFWQVPTRLYVRDGVTLILYKNIRLLNYYKVAFQNKHSSATLHRLRVLLRRTATILETFSDLFSPYVQRFCVNLLSRYHEETKFLRYLYFLDELCVTREDAKMSLYSELQELTTQEERAVMQMLLSRPFVHLIQILSRELHEGEIVRFTSLQKEVKSAVKKHLRRFEKLLAQTKEGYDEPLLEQLYASLDCIQTHLEDFFHIIGEKEVQTIVDELNILLKPLREWRNCKERALILTHIKKHASNTALDTDPLLCEHEAMLEEKIEHALKLLRSSTFYI